MGATDQQFSTAPPPMSEARGQRSEGAESIAAVNAFRSDQFYAPTPQRFNNFQLPRLNDLPNAPLSPVRDSNAHPSVELGQNQYTPQDIRSTAYQKAAKQTPLPGDYPQLPNDEEDSSADEEAEDELDAASLQKPR